MSMKQRLTATFIPQQWVNDYAMPAGDPVEFDATAIVLRENLEWFQEFSNFDYCTDRLADDLPAAVRHDGPYEVDCPLDEWLEANGVPDNAAMTQADLDRLRKEYGVDPDQPRPEPVTVILSLTVIGTVPNGTDFSNLSIYGLPDKVRLVDRQGYFVCDLDVQTHETRDINLHE